MEIKVPAVGESITEALVAKWLKKDGERVTKYQPLCEIETDKITLELNAEADGVLSIEVPEGTTVLIGALIGVIEEQEAPRETPEKPRRDSPPLSPSVRKLAQEKGLRPEDIRGTGRGGRITVDDLLKEQEKESAKLKESPEQPTAVHSEEPPAYRPAAGGREERAPLSPIRRRIAERLVAARQQTAMLTTFNEADMSRVVAMRQRHKEEFRAKHGVSLGFMPFFIKACVEALAEFPALNARIDGNDLVYQHFYDIAIAVSGEKGLVAPVLRDAGRLRFVEMEKGIAELVEKIRSNRLAISDLEGGTFTISNGGVYGSLLSTPILNIPQSAVLGMHAIQERPVAREGKVVIRPMMYLALSYDHRIVDGRESVQFLKRVKELIEEPEEMLIE